VSFSLRSGEILGICGLVGAGRTETLEILFGAAGADWEGSVRLDGREIRPTSPAQAIAIGIALVTEDRARLGVLPGLSVLANAVLPSLPRLSAAGITSVRAERDALVRQSESMRIRRASDYAPIGSLSGGNQQKVVLARWLMTNPRLLLLDEPTRGIDVGAKAEIYRVLRALADRGIGVIVSSSEMPEVLGLASRILVFSAGQVAGEFRASDATEEILVKAAFSRLSRCALSPRVR
jgi:ABC-type sugar transport system ATPase subunit